MASRAAAGESEPPAGRGGITPSVMSRCSAQLVSGRRIARVLLDRGIRVRVVETDPEHARALAEALPEAQVFHASWTDRDFLRRERLGRATAAVFALNDDAETLYAAVLAKVHGVRVTIAILRDPDAEEVFDAAGVDSAIDPAAEPAEVMVRFAHDPRTRQIAMLDDDRFEVLDIAVRADSRLTGRALAGAAADHERDRRDRPGRAGAVSRR